MLSLNLLPDQDKKNIAVIAKVDRWRLALVMLAIVIGIGTAASITAWQMLQRHAQTVHQDLVNQQLRLSTDTKTDITTTTTTLNDTIKALSSALGQPRSWSSSLSVVMADLPAGVTISDLTLSGDGQFHLKGVTNTRETFVTLDQMLKKNNHLTKIATSSTASKRTAVPFEYTGYVVSSGQTP